MSAAPASRSCPHSRSVCSISSSRRILPAHAPAAARRTLKTFVRSQRSHAHMLARPHTRTLAMLACSETPKAKTRTAESARGQAGSAHTENRYAQVFCEGSYKRQEKRPVCFIQQVGTEVSGVRDSLRAAKVEVNRCAVRLGEPGRFEERRWVISAKVYNERFIWRRAQ
eukprot:139782-Pleurochrysis_carterae.AAC.2